MADEPLTSMTTPVPSSAPCGVVSIDQFGTILDANDRLGEWLGVPQNELRGVVLVNYFSKASRIVYETSIVPLLSLKGQVDGASLDLVDSNGAKVPVLFSVAVEGSGASSITTFVFLLADARRAFERDLAKARVEAETALSSTKREGELREQFIAILGHDLRNPLASIAAAMNILSREPLGEKSQNIVALTRGSIQRMSLLIDNVLDFARNRLGGGINLTLSDDVSLTDEINQVVEELRSANSGREVLVDIRHLDGVRCDVPRIGQLLSNLLGNANTYGDPARPIHVDAKIADDQQFELAVKNFGPPIPATAMERLFDPFVRSDNHGDQLGLGLGLYIASEIAKAHQGTLDVISSDDHTVFTLRIPQA